MTQKETMPTTKKLWIKPEVLDRSSLADAQLRKSGSLVEVIVNGVQLGLTS